MYTYNLMCIHGTLPTATPPRKRYTANEELLAFNSLGNMDVHRAWTTFVLILEDLKFAQEHSIFLMKDVDLCLVGK